MYFFFGLSLLLGLSGFRMVQPLTWEALAVGAAGLCYGWALCRSKWIAFPAACAGFCIAGFFRERMIAIVRRALLAAAAGQQLDIHGMLLWLAAEQILAGIWLQRSNRGIGAVVLALLPGSFAALGEGRVYLPALFTYQLCLMLLLMTSSLRGVNPHRALRLTAILTLPLAVFCGIGTVLFRNFPDGENLRREIWHGAEYAAVGMANKMTYAGLPMKPQSTVQLRQEPPAQSGGKVIFELTAEKGGIYYLRGQDYDTYTGAGWQTDESRWEDFGGWGEPQDTVTISIADYSGLMLLPYYPGPGTMLHGGCFASTLRDYSFRVYPQGSASSPQRLAAFCRLPESTRVWAAAFLSGRKTPAQIAALVEACAVYDRQTPPAPEEETDFVQWFAESSGRGYCMHFASLTAVLLRAAGIPARYVTGFRVQTKPGKTVAVTGESAHAWAEFYDREEGCWKILEATPASAQPPDKTQTIRMVLFGAALKKAAGGIKYIPIVLLFVVYLQSKLRFYLRRRRCTLGSADSRVRNLYAEAALLSSLLGEEMPPKLILLYQRALYSRHPPDKAELEEYEIYFRECRQRLREKPWLVRIHQRLRWAAY